MILGKTSNTLNKAWQQSLLYVIVQDMHTKRHSSRVANNYQSEIITI
jgi:hypothetical protein